MWGFAVVEGVAGCDAEVGEEEEGKGEGGEESPVVKRVRGWVERSMVDRSWQVVLRRVEMMDGGRTEGMWRKPFRRNWASWVAVRPRGDMARLDMMKD